MVLTPVIAVPVQTENIAQILIMGLRIPFLLKQCNFLVILFGNNNEIFSLNQKTDFFATCIDIKQDILALLFLRNYRGRFHEQT